MEIKKDNLKLIVLKSAKELGESIDKILQEKRNTSDFQKETEKIDDYTEIRYISPIKEPRFQNGEGKIVLEESVRGYDTYIIADVNNHSITYDIFGHPEFDIFYKNELFIHIKLSILGNHNIYNALATTTLCIMHNISKDAIINGLSKYVGVERRFECIGTYKENILVYDDYAHHPTEIKSTLNSAKNIKCNKNYAIFQSHTYSRTKEHLKEFANVLKDFDNIIIAPIYPAREINIYNVKEEDLVNLIKPYNQNVIYIDSFDKIVDYLKENLEDNDLVITIGAGPVNEIGLKLLK